MVLVIVEAIAVCGGKMGQTKPRAPTVLAKNLSWNFFESSLGSGTRPPPPLAPQYHGGGSALPSAAELLTTAASSATS